MVTVADTLAGRVRRGRRRQTGVDYPRPGFPRPRGRGTARASCSRGSRGATPDWAAPTIAGLAREVLRLRRASRWMPRPWLRPALGDRNAGHARRRSRFRGRCSRASGRATKPTAPPKTSDVRRGRCCSRARRRAARPEEAIRSREGAGRPGAGADARRLTSRSAPSPTQLRTAGRASDARAADHRAVQAVSPLPAGARSGCASMCVRARRSRLPHLHAGKPAGAAGRCGGTGGFWASPSRRWRGLATPRRRSRASPRCRRRQRRTTTS